MNIFLVPAPPENIQQTLKGVVSFEVAEKYLSNEEIDRLIVELGGRFPFHCWATTDGKNRRIFDLMSPGDELLFAETGKRYFSWRGQVKTTFVSDDGFGDKVWPHAGNTGNQRSRGNKGWKLIYVIDKLEQIKIPKRRVLQLFGYMNPRDELGGLRRIPEQRTNELITHFGNMDGILNSIAVT